MSMTANEDKDISKIILQYSDGSTKDIDKGFIAKVEPIEQGDQTEITFNLVNISGSDLKVMISAIVELGFKLGMFNSDESEENDDED